MAKRPSLAEKIKARANGDAPAGAANSQETQTGPATKVTPARIGKSFIGGYFSPETSKQLRILAVEQDTTSQALIGEALNHLFAAYGKPEIAETTRQ